MLLRLLLLLLLLLLYYCYYYSYYYYYYILLLLLLLLIGAWCGTRIQNVAIARSLEGAAELQVGRQHTNSIGGTQIMYGCHGLGAVA